MIRIGIWRKFPSVGYSRRLCGLVIGGMRIEDADLLRFAVLQDSKVGLLQS